MAIFVSSFLHLAATILGINEPIKRKVGLFFFLIATHFSHFLVCASYCWLADRSQAMTSEEPDLRAFAKKKCNPTLEMKDNSLTGRETKLLTRKVRGLFFPLPF